MRTKATLFLLVLVAGLAAVAYHFNREWDAKRAAAASRVHVLGPDAVDLDFLRIEFRDRPGAIVLEKQPAGWELSVPVRWPANFFAVNRLLSQLQYLERESSFALEGGGQALADYGLDPPECVLTYGRRGERSRLEIGRTTDVGGRLYVRPAGANRVHVVNRALVDSLRLPLEEFRSSAVFAMPLFEVRSWNVQLAEAGNLRVWLSRVGDKWRMDTPVQARADKTAVETLLNDILGARVVRFETGATDLNLLRLATPAFTITFEGSTGRESLLIGAPVEGEEGVRTYYAKRDDNPTVFIIQAPFLGELRDAQLGLRDRRLLELDRARVQTVSILPLGRPAVTLQKLETGAWQVVSRTEERGLVTLPGDAALIEALLSGIADLRAVPQDGFVTDAPSAADLADTYALASPTWQIVVTERTAEAGHETRAHTVLLGGAERPGAPRVYARIADAPSVYLVDRGLADDLGPDLRHYRSRQLQQLPEGARISSLTLRRLSADEPVLSHGLASLDQRWVEALAAEPEPRRNALVALIGQLRNLHARDFVLTEFSSAVPPAEENRPWTWLLEAGITLEGGAGQRASNFRLYLDDYRGGADLLCASPDLGVVFHADQSFLDAFRALIDPRPDPGPPPPFAPAPGAPAAAGG